MKHIVCKQGELIAGQKRVMMRGKTPIVVVCSQQNEYYAVHGICPHQGAELGGGELTWLTCSQAQGTYRVEKQGEILRCPWHSFNYDVSTGECVTRKTGLRVKTYPVYVEDGNVVVET